MKPRVASFTLCILLSVVLWGTACQKQDGVTRVKSYSRDGALGITEVNPNMPMSPTYHTYMDDTRLMKDTIRQIPEVRSSTITMNGPIATVRLDVPATLSAEEAERVEWEAYDRLSKMMPRYTVKVSVSRK
ncbi:hypothetical protein GCM10023310_08290 [Paenibacillus vulneris]|uniref:Uncharacterized protein n=1 Tax=Paenibacillus vulneris TaxID=1133364 RepID=A0ABW3UW15_9BACL|nr:MULTISPECIES: hypothetical protein [unclassified Paenibacillus]MBE1443534.1 hypothetical protein [Paenibacillus sp. OAS669]